MKKLLLTFSMIMIAICSYAQTTNNELNLNDGDTFTANTAEGVEMTFKVIIAKFKLCQVGGIEDDNPAIDNSTTGSITIPAKVNGYQVVAIGDNAFESCSDLTSIEIPNSVMSIGDNAFAYCNGLTSIEIPNSVTSIENEAFYGCSGLTFFTIPNSVTYFGERVFSGCSSLSSIVVEEGNTEYDSRNNCNAIINSNTNELIAGCKNTIVPNSVMSIGNYAFYSCSGLTTITLPNSVLSIGSSAFSRCSNLISITISNSVTNIGSFAFDECSGLTSIAIPNSVTEIGSGAFYYCI